MGLTTSIREFAGLAILFADISGSTRLYERLGDSKAKKIVDRSLDILTEVLEENEGHLVKKLGDELMCTFEDPHWAAKASTEMHLALQRAALGGKFGGETPRIRVGFHFGTVIRDAGDIFGDAVNVAARVVSQAKAHQTLTTKETLALLPSDLHKATRLVDRFPIKGKSREVEIYEVIWDMADLTVAPEGFKALSRQAARMVLRFQAVEVELNQISPSVKLGRGDDNDVVVPDSQSSRLHAKVELRRERFYVTDQSLNGTYVQVEGEEEVCLRHEEFPLRGSGIISLGRPIEKSGEFRITFTVHEPTAVSS
jgi:class 3 adenylate cyclase